MLASIKQEVMKRLNLLILVSLFSINAFAWGRRGHSMVGEMASILISSQPNAEFMKAHAYDIGFYNNVPDLVWKRPASYAVERNQHYINLDAMEREFAKHPEIKDPLSLSRQEFEAKFPEIKPELGRSFWRIRELDEALTRATEQLKALPADKMGKERQELQEKWIVLAGVIGHYIGDLAMPLHVTENHDGALTNQKGIHSFFEDRCVDELYPQLAVDVLKKMQKDWPAFTKANASKTTLQLVTDLAHRSEKEIKKLLDLDKKGNRDVKKMAKIFEPMIRARIADGALTLAEVYRRNTGWKFDDNRFYFFASEPDYVWPPGTKK